MPTMIYQPGIEVRIATAGNGIIDVSADISSGSLSLNENSSSTLSLVLTNHMRKYDGLFTPNDRITVKMKRVRWLQVFSGYLNEVPYFSVYPKDVVLTASDTLKRLKYRPWDPGSEAAVTLLSLTGNGAEGAKQVDGGIRDKVVKLLTDVGGWPKAKIHMGQIPNDWFSKVTDLSVLVKAQTSAIDSQLGSSPVSGGQDSTNSSGTTGTTTSVGAPNSLCDLPAASGTISRFGGRGTSDATGRMALTGESGVNPTDPWYCAMRWGYNGYTNGRQKLRGTPSERRAAIAWLKNRKLIVSNPKTGKAVVVRAADWGPGGVPSADSRAIDVSPEAEKYLGGTDAFVQIRWAENQSVALGPTTTAAAAASAPPAGGTKQTSDATAAALWAAYDKAADKWSTKHDTPYKGAKPSVARPGTAAAEGAPTSTALTSLPFTSVPDNGGTLRGHPHAAREFIDQNWPGVHSIGGYSYRTIAGTNKLSRHGLGLALDIMVNSGGKMPTNEQVMVGNSVASWFAENPQVFQVDEIIWMNQINTGSGWRPYNKGKYANNPTLGHFDHVHLSFRTDVSPTSAGPMGGGWSNVNDAYGRGFAAGNSLTPEGGAGGGGTGDSTNLLNTHQWMGGPDPRSALLTGPRALLNDTPLLSDVARLCQVGMRNYMAGPNGDFIAWFPDYFDNYGIAGKLHISDVELAQEGFTVQHSDERLITHQFTAGAPSVGGINGGPVGLMQEVQTQGIVSVEMKEVMQALFNIDPTHPKAQRFLNGAGILNRYGARVDYTPMGTITGAKAEFFYALKLFMENWAQQFSSNVYTTFMPEAWPGMIMVVDSMKFQAYITGVSHRWDFSQGGGFHTSISITAPSSLGGGLIGLPRAGKTGKQTKSKTVSRPAKDNR